jgi:hypothetical protein
MKSMFSIGIQNPGTTVFRGGRHLGQWESVISAAINAGVQAYKIRSEEERAEDALKFKEEQAAAAAAREQEALRIQQEAIKAMQEQNKPQAAVTASSGGETILGMKPTTFFIGAGLAAGVLVLATMLLTRGK